MPSVNRPKIVNRGPTGLLRKLTPEDRKRLGLNGEQELGSLDLDSCPKDNISEALLGCVVPIESLTPDPYNARVHTDRNMKAIQESLAFYGQMKPLVVRKAVEKDGTVKHIVIAGNGTLEAAKSLSWTRVAIVLNEMDPVLAAGYGIADNRSAEFARWDSERVKNIQKRLDKYLEARKIRVGNGWSADEIEVLYQATFVPPPVDDDTEFTDTKKKVLKFSADQATVIEEVVEAIRSREPSAKKWSPEDCIVFALRDWLGEEPYRSEGVVVDRPNSEEDNNAESE